MGLPTPVGRQREVLVLPAEGHIAVLGTAGSGKTTLAILRSAYLADPRTLHHGKTLLVTYNRSLVTYLKHLQDRTLADVDIETYHRIAHHYLSSRGQMYYNAICDEAPRLQLVEAAVQAISRQYPDNPLLEQPPGFFDEEISVIAREGLRSFGQYAALELSPSYGTQVEPGEGRRVMWEICRDYRLRRRTAGWKYDWDDVASAVCRELDADLGPRLYRHVVIDEGQDFSPEMIRSLTKMIIPGGSVTFFGDVAQQIYGHRVSWRDAGLNVTTPWEFRENYRNTRQIARLALALSRMPYFSGTPDLVEPVAPTAAGPTPTLIRFATAQAELDFVARAATQAANSQTVAILVRRHQDESVIRSRLPPNAIRIHRQMSTWQAQPGIHYGTYHSAKGLEFDMVLLPLFSDDRLPDPDAVAHSGVEDARMTDGRLIYVGVTRAKTRLIMTCTGNATSLLPTTDGLYTVITR